MDPLILAIESSCDETAVAIVRGRTVLSSIVASQIELHGTWGGVVPEAAARAHVEAILPTISTALKKASVTLADIRQVAVTHQPGLVGALSVGVTAASSLAHLLKLPLVGIHHLEGHLASVRVVREPDFPMIALIASGGHTEIVLVHAWGDQTIVGETRDDAAGEAFDKSARLLGLGYPGGIAVSKAAEGGDASRYPLPRGMAGKTLEFSFSGLKTAVLRLVEKEGASLSVSDAAASLQTAITSVLADRTLAAARLYDAKTVAIVGGVAANSELRRRMSEGCARFGFPLIVPPVELCTDNAAMIGLAASARNWPSVDRLIVSSNAPL